MKSSEENRLTCTIQSSTLQDVDATTKKMIDKLVELRRQSRELDRKARHIEVALELVGIRPEDHSMRLEDGMEASYAEEVPFSNVSLVDTCIRILADYRHKSLTKSQVEYLAEVGGYKFSTDDSKNSVAITLARLAKKGLCEVKTSRGPHGNEYCWIPTKDEEESSNGISSDQGTTKTKAGE